MLLFFPMKASAGVLLIIVLVLTIACSDDDGGDNGFPTGPIATVSILTGQVLEPGGAPVEGAIVKLQTKLASTSVDGKFIFQSLVAGPHTLTVQKTGYKDVSMTITVSEGAFVPVTMERQ